MAINSTYYLNAADLATATAVYLDSSLSLIAPDGFYSDGTISREQASGVLLTQEDCGCEGAFAMAYRSTGSVVDTGTLCNTEVANIEFYLSSPNCMISSGTIAYNTNSIYDVFDGENKYYAVYVAICDNTSYTYICQINNSGVINVIDLCTF